MKIGFLVREPHTFETAVTFASENKFDCLEVRLPDEMLGEADSAHEAREKAKKLLSEKGIYIASIFSSLPKLDTPSGEMDEIIKKMSDIMDLCAAMGGAIITGVGPGGFDTSKSLEENVALYKQVYAPLSELASDKEIRIAIENWPGSRPFGPGQNLPCTPQAWKMMFDALPSDSIGLEIDPSHLMWQWIDPYLAVREFAERLFIIHLKDTEIFYDELKRNGNHSRKWWRYRLPGFGELDWFKFFAELHATGFSDSLIIEHEDPVFSDDRVIEGFQLSGNFLRAVMFDR